MGKKKPANNLNSSIWDAWKIREKIFSQIWLKDVWKYKQGSYFRCFSELRKHDFVHAKKEDCAKYTHLHCSFSFLSEITFQDHIFSVSSDQKG